MQSDARADLLALLGILLLVTTAPRTDFYFPTVTAINFLATAPALRLSWKAVAGKAALMTLFAVPFAMILIWNSSAQAAAGLVSRTFCSAVCLLLFSQTTSLSSLLRALAWFRVPAFLIEVIYFLVRFLSLTTHRVQQMRLAALSRGGTTFASARGILGSLFAVSLHQGARAQAALYSRGYTGTLPLPLMPSLRFRNLEPLLTIAGVAALRFGLAGA